MRKSVAHPDRKLGKLQFLTHRSPLSIRNLIGLTNSQAVSAYRQSGWLGKRLVFEAALVGPEAEAGVRDVEDLFAVDDVPAVFEGGGVVFRRHLCESAVLEVHAFDLLPGEMAGTVANGEAALAGAVDEVGRSAEIAGECSIFRDQFEGSRGSAVAVLADELVDRRVLAKLVDAGGEDDELGTVGQRHAGAIDAFVAQPGALELVWIEEDHGLFDLAIHHLEVHLEAERGSLFKTLLIIADEQATDDEVAVVVLGHNGKHVDDMREFFAEVFAGVVEHFANGGVGAAHHSFHSVDGAEEVTAMNPHSAAGADEDIFVVVGHPDDLVGDDLADRQDQIVATVAEKLVDLRGPGVVELSFADLMDEIAGDLSQRDDVVAPVVDAE